MSDAHGQFTARFANQSGFEGPKDSKGWRLPGWGRFYLIAESQGLSAVSRQILNEEAPKKTGQYSSDEWTGRGTIHLSEKPGTLTMRLLPGITLKGRVIDTLGKPVARFPVSVRHDLHADTHTGYGGEIFHKYTETDQGGRFVISRIYPVRFDLRAAADDEDKGPYWIWTQIRDRLSKEHLDQITPRLKERELAVKIIVVHELPYRFYGRVTGPKTKPVAGAKVTLGISTHRIPQDYSDDHSFYYANTDADGRYEIRTARQFGRFFRVTAEDFAPLESDYENRGLGPLRALPGRYNFSLAPGDQSH